MKTTSFFASFIITTLLSCAPKNLPQKGFYGKWQLLYAQGGLTGKQNNKPEKPTVLNIEASGNYNITEDGKTEESGRYAIKEVRSIFTGSKEQAIVFGDSSNNDIKIVKLAGDTLYLTDNHVEPFTSVYLRLKK